MVCVFYAPGFRRLNSSSLMRKATLTSSGPPLSKYRIQYGTSMNVYELDDTGRLKMGWCFVPQGCLVAGDVMLAQKIALETFESRALLVARRFAPFGTLRD